MARISWLTYDWSTHAAADSENRSRDAQFHSLARLCCVSGTLRLITGARSSGWPVDFAVLTRPTGIISEYNCPVYLTSKETGATLVLRTEVRKVKQSNEIAFSQRRYSLFGDYQIDPTGALGISANQRIRVDCRTFQVLGIAMPQADDVLRKSQFR